MKKLKKFLATMCAVTMCAISITPFVSNAVATNYFDDAKITDETTAFTISGGSKYIFSQELTDLFDGECGLLFVPDEPYANNYGLESAVQVNPYNGHICWFGIDGYMLSNEKQLIFEEYLTANNIPYELDGNAIYLKLDLDEKIQVWSDVKEDLGFIPFAGCPASSSEIEIESVENALPEKTLDGDANEDGLVDIADATAIIQHIGNPDKYALTLQGEVNADCHNTGDGITGNDAFEIQQRILTNGMPE